MNRDGLRKILEICSELAVGDKVVGWRLHQYLWKRVKKLAREIDRIAARKGPNYVTCMKETFRELLQKASAITQRVRELCVTMTLLNATADDVFEPNTLQAFLLTVLFIITDQPLSSEKNLICPVTTSYMAPTTTI